MTSAIAGMSVADVRKNLSIMRSRWDSNTPEQPFNSAAMLLAVSAGGFAYKFVIGHHIKRHAKSLK